MPIFRELCSRNRTRESGLRHESVPRVPCFLWARKEQSAFETFARRMPRDHKPNYWRIRLDFEEVATPEGTTSEFSNCLRASFVPRQRYWQEDPPRKTRIARILPSCPTS